MGDIKGILIGLIGAAIVFAAAGFAVANDVKAVDIALIGFIVFGTIIVLFAASVLYQIGVGKISLSGIISEPKDGPSDAEGKPKASLSRFQFLVFTFVVAGLFLMLSIEAGQFVNIPDSVLVLIGLSGTGFLVGKATSNIRTTETPEAKAKRKRAEAEEAKKRAEQLATDATAAEKAVKE